MSNKFLKFFQKNKMKLLAWLGFAGLATGAVATVAVGATHFAKEGTKNIGVGYNDSLQIQLQYALKNSNNNNNNHSTNLATVENITSKLAYVAEVRGVDQIQMKSAIEQVATSGNNGTTQNNKFDLGNVYWYTPQNVMLFNFDFDLTPEEDEKVEDLQANLDYQRLNLYYQLSNNYTYYLHNFHSENVVDKDVPIKNNSLYILNNVNETNNVSKAYRNNNDLFFDLRSYDNSANQKVESWDLSVFQEQFTSVFHWDGDLEVAGRAKIITNAEGDEENKPDYKQNKPKQTYLFWHNRNGLINLLQSLTTIAKIKTNDGSNNLEAAQIKRIETLYNKMAENSEYKAYMEWVSDNTNKNNWNNYMEIFLKAQQSDFGITAQNPSKDPLIELLNEYYISNKYKETHELEHPYEENEFLYSWNFKNDKFLNQFMQPIDYYNWFNYFEQDATDKQLKDKDYVMKTYMSKKMDTNWSIYSFGLYTVNEQIDMLNKASMPEHALTNYYYFKSIIDSSTTNAKDIYGSFFDSFIDQVVNKIPDTQLNSLFGISPLIGAIIGLSATVLIIGIIVSVLYRVPGVLMTLGTFFAFGLGLLLITNLHITFAISSVFALLVGIAVMFVPFIYAMWQFKLAFRRDKLNLNNAFKRFMATFFKMSLIVHLTFLIIALVFLFFGSYQIQTFGATLTLIGFSNIIGTFVLVLILFSLLFILVLKQNPQLMFNKIDVQIINSLKIHSMSFSDGTITETATKVNVVNNISNKVANGLINFNWKALVAIGALFLISLIGIIVLLTAGPSQSIYYSYNNQIMLLFKPDNGNIALAEQLIKELATKLNISWIDKVVYENVFNGFTQIVLTPSSLLNIDTFYSVLASFNGTYANINVEFLSTNTYFADFVVNNAVKCIFIALAFLLIFNMFAFNIINVVPIFIVSLAAIFIGFGLIAITRITLNLETPAALCMAFVMSQLFISVYYAHLKQQFNMKNEWTLKQIYEYAIAKAREVFIYLAIALGLFLIGALVMILFDTQSNILNYLLTLICTIGSFVFIVCLAPLLFPVFMYIRELYISRAVVSKNQISSKIKSYDKVDEQIITGINTSARG